MSEIVLKADKGECLSYQLEWADEGGPIDLSGYELSILEAYPAALAAGQHIATDAAGGVSELFIPATVMASAGRGRVNWLRMAVSIPGGCPITTPRIMVEVV